MFAGTHAVVLGNQAEVEPGQRQARAHQYHAAPAMTTAREQQWQVGGMAGSEQQVRRQQTSARIGTEQQLAQRRYGDLVQREVGVAGQGRDQPAHLAVVAGPTVAQPPGGERPAAQRGVLRGDDFNP